MQNKPKKPPPPTKTELKVIPCKPYCSSGTILAVDPSIGSATSMPGYALSVDGVVVDSGILSINPKAPHNQRLAGIQAQLRLVCEKPDVIVAEAIAPMLSVGGPNVVQLHWAVGVIQATYPDAYAVLVPNQTWKSQLRKLGLDNYVKTDEHDALAILLTIYQICGVRLKNEADVRTAMLSAG